MSDFNTHIKKFEMFKKDSENETVSHPTRIEAYFCATYQLIEACATKENLHINKHQLLRSFLTKEQNIFGEDTEIIWRTFQIIENQIRPGQEYGGKINGKELKKAKENFEIIEKICMKKLYDTKGI